MKVIYNTDVYRCFFVLFAMSQMIYAYGIASIVVPYLWLITLAWGYSLLVWDLVYKRKLFQMKQAWMLVAFLVWTSITMFRYLDYLGEKEFVSVNMTLNMTLFMLVLCPPNKEGTAKGRNRAILAFCLIVIIPISIMAAMALWGIVTKTLYTVGGVDVGYTRYYIITGRLNSFALNPNRWGMTLVMSSAMLAICWTLLKDLFTKAFAINAGKVLIIILALLQVTALTITGSRGARLALLLFVLLFSFIALYKVFSVKLASAAKGVLVAVLVAVIITGATYAIDKPIRISVAVVQAMASTTRVAADSAGAGESGGLELVITTSNPNMFNSPERIYLLRYGFDVIRQYPMLGISPDGPHNHLATGGGSHNIFVDIAAIWGLPALVLYLLFLMLFAVRNARILFSDVRNKNYLTAGGLLALCAAILLLNMFDTIFLRFMHVTVVFWSCLSFAASLLQSVENQCEK